ncbi:MAG TPA: cobalt transporter CbiM [Chloroflexota bacterium]|nr:cobalt transporter CbiM [Chloroflexota bacterium]
MHIPDGYLSPATVVVAYGAAAPFWYQAGKKVKETLQGQSAPLVALFAAFSFTIQMFNIPVPGGTTAHAVGGTLMAAVLGPWAAVVGLSTALVIQALFFGDGGITAIGANCFNMGIALPISGYFLYRLLSGSSPSPRRRAIAAAAGGYLGINVAGLLTGIELGIQPLLWSDGGRALYNPYGLDVTVPAMLLVHLTLAGFAEAALTGLGVAFLLRSHPWLFSTESTGTRMLGLGKTGWSLVSALGLLVVLTPLGLLAPGGADFEWGAEELTKMVGYLPAGFSRLADSWQFAPFRDYQMAGVAGDSSFAQQASAYILSAVAGVSLIFVLLFAARILLARSSSAARGERT